MNYIMGRSGCTETTVWWSSMVKLATCSCDLIICGQTDAVDKCNTWQKNSSHAMFAASCEIMQMVPVLISVFLGLFTSACVIIMQSPL